MGQNKEQLQKLREYLDRTKGQQYPFKGHWLEGEDAYLQNSWMKMLCMLLQSAGNIFEEQTLFLQRLVAGIEAEYEVETYMRQGLEVTSAALEEFIGQLLDNTEDNKDEKRYAFVLDALLLLHLGDTDEDAEELLAQMCEALRFTPEEMEALAGQCADILRQDMPSSILRAWRMAGIYSGFLWGPYLVENCGKTSKIEEDVIVAAQANHSPFDLVELGKVGSISLSLPDNNGEFSNAPCIILGDRSYLYLCGLEILVDKHLFFYNIDIVEFENCTFVGKRQDEIVYNTDLASICFSNCKQVHLINCTFRGFESRTVIAVKVPEIHVEDCSFTDCIRIYRQHGGMEEVGGVIYGDAKATKLYIYDSSFINCGSRNESYGYASSVISNCQAEIKDCRFEKCLHASNSVPDPSDSRRCLFSHILSESNNELIDSAELGPH